MPCSGPRDRPAAISASACRACRRARSNVGVMKARVWASYCSTRWISASTSSTGDSLRAAIRRDELGDREVVQIERHGVGARPGQRVSLVLPSVSTSIESGMYPTLIVLMNASWEANASLASGSFLAHLNHIGMA